MARRELQKIKGGSRNKGIALLLTMAMSLLFLILVAGFYQTVIGRQRWTHKRGARSRGSYKAEAGTQDAIAKLRLWRQHPGSGIDPTVLSDYCLDVENPTNLCPPPPPPPLPCSAPCDVRVTVLPSDANGLNKIDSKATY